MRRGNEKENDDIIIAYYTSVTLGTVFCVEVLYKLC